MAICNITGTLKNAGGALLNGELWVTLTGPIVDNDTAPDTVILPNLEKITITNGVVNLDLAESETQNTTYWFRFFKYLIPGPGVEDTPLIDFYAHVPNVAAIDFAALVPTGITKDTLDTAISRLARVLTQTQAYVEILRGGPSWKGAYSALTYYRKGDCVSYGGSTWIYINANPAAGQTPSEATPLYWQYGAKKGDPGGTGGQDTAYDSVGWDGALWAPSANAIRDVIETLARLSSPSLTGNPQCPTQLLTHEGARIANCEYVAGKISDRLSSLTVSTAADTSSGTTPASTAFVKNVMHRYSLIVDSKTSGTVAGASVSGIQTRDLNTIVNNAGDVVSVASNTFTLRPGTYRIHASAPVVNSNASRIFLWNVGAGARTVNGRPAFTTSTAAVGVVCHLSGTFTIAANTDFQIRHFCANAHSPNGLGVAASEAGVAEVYTAVELWRID